MDIYARAAPKTRQHGDINCEGRRPTTTAANAASAIGDTMEPVRTCLGCRQRVEASSLVRVVVHNGGVTADPSASLPGRGAWVHHVVECIETSIKRRAFGRALHFEGPIDVESLRGLARVTA
jgi:predicted RNA-binding protein YlxR (DUF448 family)